MKENRKVRYTKRVIRESLRELLAEKPLSRITVKELVEQADINRSTFYAHYETLPALIEEIEVEYAKKAVESLAIETYSEADFKRRAVSAFVDLLLADPDLAFWILDDQVSGAGEQYLHNYVGEQLIPRWIENRKVSKEYAEFFFEYIYDGCLGMMKRWYREPDALSEKEFKAVFSSVTEHMLSLVH